jgi:hypothetical protein
MYAEQTTAFALYAGCTATCIASSSSPRFRRRRLRRRLQIRDALRVDQGLQTYSPGESRSVEDDVFKSGLYSLGLEFGLALLVDGPHLEREENRGKQRQAPRAYDKDFVQGAVAAEGLEVKRAGKAGRRALEGS